MKNYNETWDQIDKMLEELMSEISGCPYQIVMVMAGNLHVIA